MNKELKVQMSPLSACGCYLLVIAANLVIWGALIFAVVKLARFAWTGQW